MLKQKQQQSEPPSSDVNPGEFTAEHKPDAGPLTPSGDVSAHPRKNLAEWKWKGTISVIFLTSMINGTTHLSHGPDPLTDFFAGYDVSNVANIQPRLYEAFGSIELLPWIGLSYSLANFAVLSLARKITYCADMRWIYLVNMLVFMAGAAVSGSADSMSSVIAGRIIMGVGGSLVQQT